MNKTKKMSIKIFNTLLGYVVAIGAVALATWLKYLAQPTIIPADVPILYILAIVPTAIFFGLGPSLMVCILSFLAYDYYFISPAHTITFNIDKGPILVIFLIVGVLFSYLASNLRRQNQIATKEIVARKQSEAELIKYRDHLEELVQQRTSELEKTNFELKEEVSERQKDEEALKLSEQNFRNSMDSSTIGIRIMGDDNSTAYANQALLDIFGYENIEELKASPPQAHYTPESQAGFVERHEKFTRGESLPEQLEFDIIRKDGAIRHLQLSSKKVLWNGKQQFQLLYNDITVRKRAEDELIASELRYRRLFESAKDGILIVSPVTGLITNVNPYLIDLLGYSFEEFMASLRLIYEYRIPYLSFLVKSFFHLL